MKTVGKQLLLTFLSHWPCEVGPGGGMTLCLEDLLEKQLLPKRKAGGPEAL